MSVSPYLKIGIILAIFKLSGNTPSARDLLIIRVSGFEINSKEFLIICIGMLSKPETLPFVIDIHISRSSFSCVGLYGIRLVLGSF